MLSRKTRSSEYSLGLTWDCDAIGTGIEKERELYRPHADLCNHVIDVLQGRPNLMVQEGGVIRFDRIDPYVVRGSTAMVKPDIVGVLRILFNTPEGIAAHEFINTIGDKSNTVVDEPNPNGDKSKESKSQRKHTDYIPGWPHVLEVKEMKGTDDTIDEGYDAIRLKTKGKIFFAEANVFCIDSSCQMTRIR